RNYCTKKKVSLPSRGVFPFSLSLFPVAWPAGGAAKRAAPVSRILCMAENMKFAEGSYVANELDMLSLASSVYTAPLFQTEFDSVYVPEYGDVGNSQDGLFPGLFISDGFVFPPSEHENLPIESDLDGSNNNNNGQESSCAGNIYEGCNEPAKEVDGRSLSVSGDLHSANETTIPNLEPPEIRAEQEKDNATIKCDLPCEGWLKRKSNCLSHRMKGVTTVCTIVAAGALMGFVIIGQRWQQDKLHLHHFQFNIGTEGVNRIVGIFSRCKDALPSSQQLKSLLPTRVLPQEPVSA
ncbi:Os07g0418200, partial [Oryza sativa Japonica Group]